MDDAGGGRIDIVIVCAGVQGVDLSLQIINGALCIGDALRHALHGGVVQALDLALALLHHALDLGIGVARRLVDGGIKGLLLDLALIGLVLVVVGLVLGAGLAEIVGVVLDGAAQFLVLRQLGTVDLQLAFQIGLLHIQVGALDMGHQVTFVDIAALRDVQLGNGTGVAGHDKGLVFSLYNAGGLAYIDTGRLDGPYHQKSHQPGHSQQQCIAVGRQLFFHHDAAVLQVVQVLHGHIHSVQQVSINTSTTASSSSWLT